MGMRERKAQQRRRGPRSEPWHLPQSRSQREEKGPAQGAERLPRCVWGREAIFDLDKSMVVA